MSDDEDDDRPPTEKEQRKWRQFKLDRERSIGLAYYYGGIPTSLGHDEWLREERRKKRAREKNREKSTAQPRPQSEFGDNHDQSEDESSDGSIGTLHPTSANQSMDLMRLSSQQSYPTDANINIHSPTKDKWFGMVAIIDSGTKENWISETIATRCGLRIEGGPSICCQTFNGQLYETDRVVKVTWRVEGVRKSEYTKHYVGENAPYDVIFGSNLVQATPELFRTIPMDPNLILTQRNPDQNEKKIIEQNRTDHKAKSKVVAEKTREKKQERGGKASAAGGQANQNEKK